SIRPASGPPPASAAAPASTQAARGVRVGGAIRRYRDRGVVDEAIKEAYLTDIYTTVHMEVRDDSARTSYRGRTRGEPGLATEGSAGAELSAEQWARAVLADPPLAVRARLLLGWTALGLRLGAPWSEHRVLGWKIERRDPGYLLLTARSWLGLRGELLFRREPHGLLFATFIQQSNPAARTLWGAITTTHQQTVRSLITHAARRQRVAV